MKNALKKLMVTVLLACLFMVMGSVAVADDESIYIARKGNGDIYFGDQVTLEAFVNNVPAGYTITWEYETEDGWVQIATGDTYTFTVTQANANYVYRAVLVIAE